MITCYHQYDIILCGKEVNVDPGIAQWIPSSEPLWTESGIAETKGARSFIYMR